MLHIAVGTHNPESCGAHTHLREQHQTALRKLAELAPGKGMTIQGQWVDPIAHTVFSLVDAPNAHVIQAAVMESGLIGLWSFAIHPVIPGENAMQALPQVP